MKKISTDRILTVIVVLAVGLAVGWVAHRPAQNYASPDVSRAIHEAFQASSCGW